MRPLFNPYYQPSPPRQQPLSSSFSLEDTVNAIIANTLKFQQERRASREKLENSMSQLAISRDELDSQEKLSIQIEPNPSQNEKQDDNSQAKAEPTPPKPIVIPPLFLGRLERNKREKYDEEVLEIFYKVEWCLYDYDYDDHGSCGKKSGGKRNSVAKVTAAMLSYHTLLVQATIIVINKSLVQQATTVILQQMIHISTTRLIYQSSPLITPETCSQQLVVTPTPSSEAQTMNTRRVAYRFVIVLVMRLIALVLASVVVRRRS
ncbi:hypothetical protein Gohar_021285 [Gossypium harknessii]|uniref:Uncharacterized protein n=1 Tax=Gossypium harknessii TaxID=34285 RepID=A0A7J9IFF2_9ROSI|nr:hypothetical protein [Gossypium harknessii]